MNQSILTILRDKRTNTAEFRTASDKVAHYLAQQALEHVQQKQIPITTPVGKTKGCVQNKDIMLLPILRAGLPEGIKRLQKNFPKMKVITAVVDKKLNKHAFIVPGVGDYGDRYFGTD